MSQTYNKREFSRSITQRYHQLITRFCAIQTGDGMKQTSIFDYPGKRERFTEYVDLTEEENPFLEELKVKREKLLLLLLPPLLLPPVQQTPQLPPPELAPYVPQVAPKEPSPKEPSPKEVTLKEETPKEVFQELGDQEVNSSLLRFYDSDSDHDSDQDYNYVSENDIDLNYQSDDESEYCFKMLGDISRHKLLSIDHLNPIELCIETSWCPICHVSLGDVMEEYQNLHINQCLEHRNSIVPPKPKLSKAPSLIKQPLYRNKDSATPSPVKTLKAPKSLPVSNRKNGIPDLKIMTFPMNPSMGYSISMDAFNFAPHDDILMYFLSHFHLDHYGGISKKWCYERVFDCVDDFDDLSKYKPLIYCTEVTGRLLTLKYGIHPKFIQTLDLEKKYLIQNYDLMGSEVVEVDSMDKKGLYVTLMTANHCPGSAIFLFESVGDDVPVTRYLHCGDFRVNKAMLTHPCLKPFLRPYTTQSLDRVYLDTTYLTFHYDFPKQENVCEQAARMFYDLLNDKNDLLSTWFGVVKQSRITDFVSNKLFKKKKKFLILVGTYVIGKERLAITILETLSNCPIYILNIKSRDNQFDVVKTFGNDYLDQYVTENEIGNDTCECVIHLVPMGIVYKIEDLSNYFYHNKYFDHFERCIGLRPTGWSYTEDYLTNEELSALEYSSSLNDPLSTNQFLNKLCDICLSDPPFTYEQDMLPQNKKTTRTTRNPERDVLRIYSLPYSEHSSYRELSYFCLFLKIKEIIPTVNTESASSVEKMNKHIGFWRKAVAIKKSRVKDLAIDQMVADKLRSLTLERF